ncbi:MAG: hypothetical protein WBC97_10645 [Gemmatimonadales bacterium]
MSADDSILATIEQLEAERAQLDTMIAFLRQRVGTTGEGGDVVAAKPIPRANKSELRSDTFFGMKAPDAVKAYLAISKAPKPASDITKALLGHGFTTSSVSPANSIRTTLGRLEASGDVVQVKKDWALAEWYPGRKNKRAKKEEGESGEPDVEDVL